MKLYQFKGSSFSEKIRRVLAYKGLKYEGIDASSGEKKEELVRISGRGMVPVLVEEGVVIVDSTNIAQYLEENYSDKPIYPKEPGLKGLTLLVEDWADEVLNRPVKPLALSHQKKRELSNEERKKFIGQLGTYLDTLDAILSAQEWLVAGRFTLADIAVSAQIWRTSAFPEGEVVARCPHLVRWKKRVEQILGG